VSKKVPLKNGYFPAIGLFCKKTLAGGTDMLLIMTSTDDVLFSGINTDDLGRPRALKIRV